MADRPIIFSAPMIRALLEGRKTQHRLIIKPAPEYGGPGRSRDPQNWADLDAWGWENHETGGWDLLSEGYTGRIHYAPGDRLWAREAFITGFDMNDDGRAIGDRKVWYRATDRGLTWYDPDTETTIDNPPWKSSIHMPRWASRITLTVTDVRVQRVQEISAADAIAEGIAPAANSMTIDCDTLNPRDNFASLWTSIHGPGAWDANPWVAAITFTVRNGNIDHD